MGWLGTVERLVEVGKAASLPGGAALESFRRGVSEGGEVGELETENGHGACRGW